MVSNLDGYAVRCPCLVLVMRVEGASFHHNTQSPSSNPCNFHAMYGWKQLWFSPLCSLVRKAGHCVIPSACHPRQSRFGGKEYSYTWVFNNCGRVAVPASRCDFWDHTAELTCQGAATSANIRTMRIPEAALELLASGQHRGSGWRQWVHSSWL